MAQRGRRGKSRRKPSGEARGSAGAALERLIRIPEPIEGRYRDEAEAAFACLQYLHDFLRAAEEAGTFDRDRDR